MRPPDLADEVFITHPDSVPETWRDFWLLTEQLGRRPPVHDVRADTVEKWLYLVQRGAGVDTCPAYVARYYAWPTLRFVPLRDAPPATLAVLRRARRNTPLTAAFQQAVVTAAAHHPTVRSAERLRRAPADGERHLHPAGVCATDQCLMSASPPVQWRWGASAG